MKKYSKLMITCLILIFFIIVYVIYRNIIDRNIIDDYESGDNCVYRWRNYTNGDDRTMEGPCDSFKSCNKLGKCPFNESCYGSDGQELMHNSCFIGHILKGPTDAELNVQPSCSCTEKQNKYGKFNLFIENGTRTTMYINIKYTIKKKEENTFSWNETKEDNYSLSYGKKINLNNLVLSDNVIDIFDVIITVKFGTSPDTYKYTIYTDRHGDNTININENPDINDNESESDYRIQICKTGLVYDEWDSGEGGCVKMIFYNKYGLTYSE